MEKQTDFINWINNTYINNDVYSSIVQASQEIARTQQIIFDSAKPFEELYTIKSFRNTAKEIAQSFHDSGLGSALTMTLNSHTKNLATEISNYHTFIPSFEFPKELFEQQMKFREQLLDVAKPRFSEKIDFNPMKTAINNALMDHSPHFQTTASAIANLKPAIDLASSFSSYINSMPDMDFRIKTIASELSSFIADYPVSIEDIYYPPKKEIDEFLNDTFHDEVATDVPSYKEQYNQHHPERHSDNGINTKKINESVYKTEFLSKVSDPWWYANFAFDKALELLFIGIIGYTSGLLNYEQFVYFFNQLLKLFKLNS